jgi:ribosomal protein S17E
MGKIKSKSIKRAAEILRKQNVNFSNNFDENKKILGEMLPSKKLRNQMAGLLAKIKKREMKSNAQK